MMTEWALRIRPARPGGGRRIPPVVLLAVYRERNSRTMEAFLRRAGLDADVRLWSLDGVAPALAHLTIGSGPGMKFRLLNDLLEYRAVPEDAYVVVADDDVVLGRRTLADAVTAMMDGGVGLAMPAHSPASHFTYYSTVARTATRMTLVDFVEIGPVFIVAPDWAKKVLPFPDDAGMGWGLDIEWSGLEGQGCRLAVLDACRMFHCVPPARTYDQAPETERLEAAMHSMGVATIDELLRPGSRWRTWQRRPPWSVQAVAETPRR